MMDDATNRGWIRSVALRHPVHRIVAQYFQSAPRREWRQRGREGRSDAPYSARTPRRGNDGATHLVIELDNLYVKVLSGVAGSAVVGRRELEQAKEKLSEFGVVFVTEWLSSPPFQDYLSDVFCFAETTATLKYRHHKGAAGDVIPVPDLRQSRVTDLRGQEKEYAEQWRRQRYGNASWWSDEANTKALVGLKRRNQLDMELYQFASGLVRGRVGSGRRGALPPLPCSGSGSECAFGGVQGAAPTDRAILGSV
mmetsp:Transcript_31123/g.53623  ORF Transcript_31123/g.53623 Transcript_31123/m.53623 type:complete len:253 (+) Transcript_31123:239-997(+)|eukprot:CAMPEP_0205946356 /NCGR_PEP_ID=MMETSP1325-20131115/68993_1 /ASSEMBLY_ACC=CAM_ASM_000708 /TAXON_ID=236786 /ORGANISM="Florenciella sp., Strain RCC1007" /LENGTH=252 /DNA_ID=CAMNT_0053317419 /DNA_START=859 /DNA_END=1617 /DNA_ORIENTATION=-